MDDIISEIRKELNKHIDKAYRDGAKNFFKEKVNPIGVRLPIVRKIAGKYYKELKDSPKLNKIGNSLVKSHYFEEVVIGLQLLEKTRDIKLFESFLDNYIHNWAHCDFLCTKHIALTLKENPNLIKVLYSWAKSKNRWKVRASSVSLVTLVNKGIFIDDALKIAKINFSSKDDLVQKGNGWMLRQIFYHDKKLLYKFVMKNRKVMPRTTLRYAIEKFPENERKILMS